MCVGCFMWEGRNQGGVQSVSIMAHRGCKDEDD